MSNQEPYPGAPMGMPDLTRRRFVQGLASGGIMAGLGLGPTSLFAAPGQRGGPDTLRGTDFRLDIGQEPVNFTGSPAVATTINGSVPAPVLRWREGDTVTLRVTNRLPVTSSIHWHGIILPEHMDGVPGISFDGIAPGQTFNYRFKLGQTGTYWYHSHSGFQEQTGMYGAIVVDPRGRDPYGADRDYVVVLSDWSDEDPQRVYAKLKKLSHYYNRNERTFGDLMRDIEQKGITGAWNDRQMWNDMRMSDRDLSDVTGYTYTFLMNGQTPAEGWTGLFRRGEKIRLRFINAAAMTFFDLRIPGLKMTVVAADGQDVEPVTVDEFRIGVAETLDVLVEPKSDRAYSVFAQAIDRSGYARGTLTPDPSLKASVPPMDPLPILTHMDMGMDMSSGAHAGHDMSAMDHSGHDMSAKSPDEHAGHDMSKMDHSQHAGHDMSKMDHSQHGGQNMSKMDHSQHAGHDMGGMKTSHSGMGSGRAGYGSNRPVVHAKTERGPHVDMLADGAQYRLDDPGVGLRNNGRRVLTYADLRNRHKTPDPREPGREIQLHLTGNMSRYMWSVNGIKFADAEPVRLNYGERMRITLVNDTMMNHPIHLHGMWSDLETGDGKHIPRKHTVVVQPGAKISYLVTADARGGWAYHCHLLYHMPGMFRKVVVS
ncbi:MAG: copper resistance system multicopper oxidase [Gammaproteobacteria bacterium]